MIPPSANPPKTNPRHRWAVIALLLLAIAAPPVVATANDEQKLFQLMRGLLLAEHGKFEEGAKILSQIGNDTRDPNVMRAATRLALQAKRYDLAKEYVGEWVRYGGDITARQTQAELYLLEGDYAEAEKLLAGLMTKDGESAEDLLRQLSIVRDKAVALAMAERLLPKDDARAQYLLGVSALQIGNLDTATRAATAALSLDRTPPQHHFLLANIEQNKKNSAAALPVLKRYVAAQCHNALPLCELDPILWGFGNQLQGQEWQPSLSKTPKPQQRSEWATAAGNWYEQWGMTADALQAYTRAGDWFAARLGTARITEKESGAPAALAILLKAEVRNRDDYVRRESAIARLLRKTEGVNSAVDRLLTAKQTAPDNFFILYDLSLFLEEQGDIHAAIHELMRITQLFPENPDGWNALGYVMADNNIDLENAQQYIERALSYSPENASIIDSLGWVYYRRGKLAQARFHLEKAASLSDSAEIAAHLGEVLWELSDKKRAIEVWKNALLRDKDNKVLNETIGRYHPF